MQDNLFKRSLRLWSRFVAYAFRLVASPVILLAIACMSIPLLVAMAVYWITNNDEDFAEDRKGVLEHMKFLKTWFTFGGDKK